MSYSIEQVVKTPTVLGEGPHWDAETQTLYFVDIISKSIHKYKPSTKEYAKASTEQSPSFIIPIAGSNNKFLISQVKDLAVISWDGVSDTISKIEKVAETDDTVALKNNRLNDGKVDFVGRLWTGSWDQGGLENKGTPPVGRIVSFNKKRQLKYHVDGIELANGLAWNESLKKFYYIDSVKRRIDQFDYDVENELITNRQTVFSLDKHNIEGLPDGQTIDADGNLWVAIFMGSRVIKIDPRVPETLLQTIEFPAKQVTSVTFGGMNLDELYVTTARHSPFINTPFTPFDGIIYRVTGLGVKGLPGVPFKFED